MNHSQTYGSASFGFYEFKLIIRGIQSILFQVILPSLYQSQKIDSCYIMKNVFYKSYLKIMGKSYPNFEYDQLKLTAGIKHDARDEKNFGFH